MERQTRCSRKVPAPFKVWTRELKTGKTRLKYLVYADTGRFKAACKKCRFLCRESDRFSCLLRDEDFDLKFYGLRPAGNIKAWVGTVPPALEQRSPLLYRDVSAYLEKGRAGSFRPRKSSRSIRKGTKRRNKPEVAAGKTAGFPGSGANRAVLAV